MPFDSPYLSLLSALEERGYLEPTPVQSEILAARCQDRDLVVSAQTGSGKTIAYGFAIAPALLDSAPLLSSTRSPVALVVVPTRELALQVKAELGWLYAKSSTRIASCVGGVDVRLEARALSKGAHLVVGTPGRLCDHLERGRLDISKLRTLVLDEADEMLKMGFREELERLLSAAPTERRTLLFSATIPREIAVLAKTYQKDALRIAANAVDEAHGDIEYLGYRILERERERAVVNVLRHLDARGALVFCSTRESVKHLHANLLERGFSVVALSGELTQPERTRALEALRDGRAKVCVATDVAARGLDLPDLGLVIHADLPKDRQGLLHRSGRTGRAGRKGTCVLLVPESRRGWAAVLLRQANVRVRWSSPPSLEDIRAKDQVRIVRELATMGEEIGEDDRAAARALLATQSAEDLVAALVRHHRSLLPAPEELTPLPTDGAPQRGRHERPTPARRGSSNSVWFRLNVGRSNQADPRWLIPLLCRRGGVRKTDLGQIRILARETLVEVSAARAADFSVAVRRPDTEDGHIRIEAYDESRRAPAKGGKTEHAKARRTKRGSA